MLTCPPDDSPDMPPDTLVPTPTLSPPTKYQGGFVMFLNYGYEIYGDVQLRVGGYLADQTAKYTHGQMSEMILMDVYADSSHPKVNPTDAIPFMGHVADSPPSVIAGRAYIDGKYAPDGTIVTAWANGEEIVDARTTVVNNPAPMTESKLLRILQAEIPQPSPLPFFHQTKLIHSLRRTNSTLILERW